MIDAAAGRLFVVLTVAEAAAILRPKPSPDRDRGLAKIRGALSGACQLTGLDRPIAPPDRPPVAVIVPARPTSAPTRPIAAVDPQAQRHVRPPTRAPQSSSSSLDDYLPWRDEADGIYR